MNFDHRSRIPIFTFVASYRLCIPLVLHIMATKRYLSRPSYTYLFQVPHRQRGSHAPVPSERHSRLQAVAPPYMRSTATPTRHTPSRVLPLPTLWLASATRRGPPSVGGRRRPHAHRPPLPRSHLPRLPPPHHPPTPIARFIAVLPFLPGRRHPPLLPPHERSGPFSAAVYSPSPSPPLSVSPTVS